MYFMSVKVDQQRDLPGSFSHAAMVGETEADSALCPMQQVRQSLSAHNRTET